MKCYLLESFLLTSSWCHSVINTPTNYTPTHSSTVWYMYPPTHLLYTYPPTHLMYGMCLGLMKIYKHTPTSCSVVNSS